MVGIGLLVKQKIVRAGFAGDVDPAELRLAKRTKLIRRRYVQDVDAGARPLRKDGCARYGFDGDDGGP